MKPQSPTNPQRRTFSVLNFDRFQHYKDRNPPWIKLYNELLDDYHFSCLQDASKLHLILIWLLASRTDNKLPYDSTWISRRINASEHVNLQALAQAGFILVDETVDGEIGEQNQPLHNAEQDAGKMLASFTENKLSDDPALISHGIETSDPVGLNAHVQTGAILTDDKKGEQNQPLRNVEQDASTLLARCTTTTTDHARPETETEGETETETEGETETGPTHHPSSLAGQTRPRSSENQIRPPKLSKAGHNPPAKTKEIDRIFDYWRETMQHPRAKLDSKRRTKIDKALKLGYTESELKQAVLGCSVTPHNMGVNDRNQRYDSVELIFRDADHIDRFIRNGRDPPSAATSSDNVRLASNIANAEQAMAILHEQDQHAEIGDST